MRQVSLSEWCIYGFGTIWGLGLLGTAPWMEWHLALVWSAKLNLVIILALISLHDWQTGRIPPLATWTFLLIGTAFGLVRLWLGDASALAFWMGAYLVWRMRLMGGGDAKILMGVFGVWPDLALLCLIAALLVASGGLVLVARYRWSALSRLVENGARFVRNGMAMPRGAKEDPATWVYALAIALYAVLAA